MADVVTIGQPLPPDGQPNPKEEEHNEIKAQLQALGCKALIGTITYPLTFVKTLFQLGYEPYPLSVGRTFIVAGRNAYYLPNVVQYLRGIVHDFGAKTLYTGVESAILSTAVGGGVIYTVGLYLDNFYPDVGGAPYNSNRPESELSDAESARIKIRQAIRDTITHTAGVIVSHPFSVIMVREIAQLIGGEHKYHGLISLYRIGEEEGLSGFFAGLVPTLISDYIFIWGVAALHYTVERVMEHTRKSYTNPKEEKDFVESTARSALNLFLPLLANSFTYPFRVVAVMMAVGGSGLAVSSLPYAPTFGHWSDAYAYLKPHGLTRGSRLFLREQKGAISVGSDHHLYASNKIFI